MRVTLLGPVTATAAAGPLALGGPRQRAVLAMLALAAPRLVTVDALIEGIWGGAEPANPGATLQVFVHNLRKALKGGGGDGLLRYQAPGYVLDASVEVDVRDFRAAQHAARDARHRGDDAGALAAYDNALSLWTGPALADVRDLPFATLEAAHLEQERLLTVEERIDVALALGRHAQEVAELGELVRTHPTRERLCGQLMTALYRCDRQADALQAYAQARERLADELGIDPGEALRQLELGILRQDPALAAPAIAATPAPAMTGLTTPPPEESARARPAPPTAPRARGRIPRPPTRTIGREALVEHVVAVLSRPDVSVASLIGLGGTGKSRIAMVAAESARARALFDAVYFVEVTEATEANQLFREIALLFGADDGPDALASLGNATGITSGLLVLDNLESLPAGADFVVALTTAAPYLTVLVTSRLGLRLNREHEIPVPPLDVPEPAAEPSAAIHTGAAELFVERVQASAPTLTLAGHEEQVCRVVRLLDGVPLALELAAARVRLLGLTGVEDGLRAGLDILSSTAPDLPARQRTISGTIEWSYSRLSDDARRLCHRVALFERGFTIEAVEAIASDLPNVLELLGELLDARLIRSVAARVGIRFVALGTVRTFAAARLAGEPHLAEHRRHLARHLLGQTRTLADCGPTAAVDIARFDENAADIEAAIRAARERGEVSLATDLVVASTPWWLASGRAREGRDLSHDVRTLVGDGGPVELALRLASAQLAYHLTDWPSAISHATAARDLAIATGDRAAEATAACYLGAALVVTGSPERGQELARAAYDLASELALYPITAVALSAQAIACAIRGDFDGERRHYERRLAVVRARQDNARTADTLNTLAEIALDADDPTGAYDLAGAARDLAGVAFPPEARDATITLARAALLLGRPAEAAGLLQTGLTQAERSGQSLALAQCIRVGAGLATISGQAAVAVRLFAAAQEVSASPNGTTMPVESDFATQLGQAQDDLGEAAARQAWLLGEIAGLPETKRSVLAVIAEYDDLLSPR